MEETQRRRISILCSHIISINNPRNSQFVSTSNCSSDNHQKGIQFNDCVFCHIILGNSPAFKLYEDDVCLCILDTNPLSRGHCLLIPKLHYRSLDETPPSVIAATCAKIPFISSAVKKATGCILVDIFEDKVVIQVDVWPFCDSVRHYLVNKEFSLQHQTMTEEDSFNLLVNNGEASGQVIFHTHIHIIPRKPRDRLWDSESLRRKSVKLDQEASQLAESIRTLLSHESQSNNFGEGSNLASNCKEKQ